MTTRTAPAPTVPSRRSVPVRHRKRRAGALPWLFLALPLLLLAVFTYIPVISMAWYSSTSWNGVSKRMPFVGAENYVEIFTRPQLFEVFLVSLYYVVAAFLQLGVALYFATLLSFRVRFGNLFKGLLFFPYLVNGVAIAFVFLYFFRPDGTLDSLLNFVGLSGHQWLGDPDTVNYSLAGVSVWRYTGLNFVLFLGAIQSIPSDLYEASDMDGATRWQQFRHIILPGIRPVVGLMSILALAGSLSVFEIPYIMTGGANGSRTFVIQTVDMAFRFDKVGLASAMAFVLLALVLLVTWVQRRLFPDDRSTTP
ncbi:carbohydrate ABC transporter membrane protein 1 (CUT1 family) [Saccharothrix texasensis]|uniref:Carbohydrate ABC transporter membrane protein 1 (CUT1 family) n=1 Tax=Saccharothrix texasensis TaxID=103734 RepID=A0A3N1HH04_9PSEU|nr:carbohydrate ABC transporter membrane protein 1 (CUT1 family) [Saccharothrix texasensis]